LAPRFISVTYAAVGITRDLTRDVFTTLHKSSGLRAAAHLTCVDASHEETLEIAASFSAAGVADIVALHGDPAKGQTRFRPDLTRDICHALGATTAVNLEKIA